MPHSKCTNTKILAYMLSVMRKVYLTSPKKQREWRRRLPGDSWAKEWGLARWWQWEQQSTEVKVSRSYLRVFKFPQSNGWGEVANRQCKERTKKGWKDWKRTRIHSSNYHRRWWRPELEQYPKASDEEPNLRDPEDRIDWDWVEG